MMFVSQRVTVIKMFKNSTKFPVLRWIENTPSQPSLLAKTVWLELFPELKKVTKATSQVVKYELFANLTVVFQVFDGF